MIIKVLSWNILGGKYLEGVIDQLKEINADIIGLQEVKELINEEDRVNIAQEIAQSLGYKYFYCAAFTDDRHQRNYDLGNAILSRFPIKGSRCTPLSGFDRYEGNSMTEPRNACVVEVEIEGKTYEFISTHFGWHRDIFESSEIQLFQLENLLKILKENQTVLCGDFNSLPTSPVIEKLSGVLENSDQNPDSPTFIGHQTEGPVRIDYIFTTSDLKTKNFQIIETTASDHKPILVEVELPS